MGTPGNKQADEEAKAALDDDIQQNEEYPPEISQKVVKNRNDKEQKRAREKRKQQHERKKDKTRIWQRHKRYEKEGTDGNLQTETGIYESYLRTTNERNHRPTVWDCTETEQTKREMMMTPEIWTRGAEGMKKIIVYTKKIGFYDGIWKTEEKRRHKNPSCKSYPEKQPHPKPKISQGSLSKSQSDQQLSHETRSDLKARL
jgi:hypothetical protein